MTDNPAAFHGYSPPDMAVWAGRVDAQQPRAALRWHQVVEPLDLKGRQGADPELRRGFCFIGYRSDLGVARNLGRPGAASGPASIRKQMANLPVGFSADLQLLDAGDIICGDGPVEQAQEALAAAVARVMDQGLFPIILGGGHDLTYGHYLGARRSLGKERRLGVVSFDAHFDLRPLDGGATSGTSFRQIAREREEAGGTFDYLCIGIQPAANTVALFRRARELGVEHVQADEIGRDRLDEVRGLLGGFARRVDSVMVTVDADVVSSAFAPGVSAPQPLGLDPETVVTLLKGLLATGGVVSLDIAEVSPPLDTDHKTARIAALVAHAVVDTLTPGGEKILEE
jgi:formiminoglutamase